MKDMTTLWPSSRITLLCMGPLMASSASLRQGFVWTN